MDKKNNIEELFKDSMDDFRVDPPEETSKKILLGLLWANFIYKYKGAMLIAAVSLVSAAGALFYIENTRENIEVSKSNIQHTNFKESTSQSISRESKTSSFHKDESSPNQSLENSNASTNGFDKVLPNRALSSNTKSIVKGESSSEKKLSTNKLKSQKSYSDDLSNEFSAVNNTIEYKAGEQKNEAKSLDEYSPQNVEQSNLVLNDKPSEVPISSTTESKNQDVSSAEIKIDSVIKTDVSAVNKSDSLASTDSLKVQKKDKVNFFAGLGASETFWVGKYNDYSLNATFQPSIYGGVEYRNYRFATGVGYEQQMVREDNAEWVALDSFPVFSEKIEYDSIAKQLDTTVVLNCNSFESTFKIVGATMSIDYLTIPIQLAYAYRFKKSEISLKAALSMQFLLSSKIVLLSQVYTDGVLLWQGTESGVDMNAYTPNPFLLNYSVHVNYGYHISERWMIMGGAYTRSFLTKSLMVSKSSNTQDSKPRGWGGELQVIYKF
ncbi:MAG: hypothetical protein ACO3EE_06875 [Flavobacteriales bacterium]